MSLFERIPIRQFGYYFLTGLILVVPALMNNYPLMYSDSGSYIATSRHLLPPIDRPVGYGLILRAVTWQSTLWTVVFFQGMVASWLIREVLRTIFPVAGGAWRPHVVFLTALLLFSSLPWYTSQVMPDVFSGFLALCAFLLLFGRKLAKWKIALLWVFFFFFTISHYSHFAMIILLAMAIAVASLRTPWRLRRTPRFRWGVIGLFIIPVLGILCVKAYNARHGFGYVVSPTSSLFLSGKLIESGVMHTYLQRNCATEPYFLCDKMDQLNTTGMHYVWDGDAPTRQGLGLVESSARLDTLVGKVLTDLTMWPMIVWTSCVATAVQFSQVTIGSGIVPYPEDSSPTFNIRQHLPHELPAFRNGMEQRGAWNFDYINLFARPLFFLGCMGVVVLWPPRRKVRLWSCIMILVSITVLNAAATGALANVYDRLQARVTWLILFSVLILLTEGWATVRAIFYFPRPGVPKRQWGHQPQ